MAQEQTRSAPDGRGKADGRVPPRPRPPGPEQARGTAQTGAVGNCLFERDRDTTGDLRFFEKGVRRTHHNIVFAFRHRRIIAPKRDFLFARALLDLDLVAKRNRRHKCLDFVKAVAAMAQNSKREIDLRRSEDLHKLQFALSFRAKSRNLLLLVDLLRCPAFARNDNRC